MHRGDRTQVLFDLCHAFASATDPSEATAAAVGWARAAVGDLAAARLVLLDGDDRLRLVVEDGPATEAGRKRSGRRREAMATGRPARLSLRSPAGHDLAILPLICRGEPIGVLEVTAPSADIDQAWEVLHAVAAQTAIVLRNVRRWDELEKTADAARNAATPVRDVVRAETAEDAVRAALRWIHQQFGAPVAAWLVKGGSQLRLLGVRRMGSVRRRELRSRLGALPRLPSGGRDEDVAAFARVAGVRRAALIEAGDSVLMVGTPPVAATVELLEFLGSVLQATLERREELVQVRRREHTLDRGIACTAHEFRGPLLGARAVIDLMIAEGDADRETIDLLRRSGRELQNLAQVVEGLLRWSVGSAPIRRRRVHLGRLLLEVVASCELEHEEGRVVLADMDGIRVWADRRHLRSAISNVIRNALEYSPPGAPVHVGVERSDGTVTVSIRDRGPGIPADERDAIFDPFVRGEAVRGRRDDRGLGLFIARRVVEAHGGRISVASGKNGATFRIGLPAEENAS